MKYQTGDKILVLHSQEEGEVVDIINDKMVMIEVGKVRFPVYTDQIDFPYFKRFTAKTGDGAASAKKNRKFVDDIKKEKAPKHKVSEGVWLSFLPVFDKDIFDDDVVESFKLYLINQTDESYRFSYNLSFLKRPGFELKNELLSLSEFYLHNVLLEEMNDAPRFGFEFSLIDPDKKKADYYETSLKIKARQLFQKIEEIRLKNEPTFSYKLFEKYPGRPIDDRPEISLPSSGRVYDLSKARQFLEPARSVIDLHIEKLSDDWQHMSNFEILTLQLKTFEKYYELAVAHRQPSLTVIHGIGTGKLRDELHEILKYKKEVKSFINQYHHDFGYGATEIYFSYGKGSK